MAKKVLIQSCPRAEKPSGSDYSFSALFLPNPFGVPSLKNLTGKDKKVQEWIERSYLEQSGREFSEYFHDALGFFPHILEMKDKDQIKINVFCVGGKHRSVFFAEKFKEYLEKTGDFEDVSVEHTGLKE